MVPVKIVSCEKDREIQTDKKEGQTVREKFKECEKQRDRSERQRGRANESVREKNQCVLSID